MKKPAMVTSDWIKNWQTSIAVKITAAVLYAVAATGFAIAIILMHNVEKKLDQRYHENADRFAYRAAQDLYREARPLQEAAAALQGDVPRLGFEAVEISRDGQTVMLGTPAPGAVALSRSLPAAQDGKAGGRPALQMILYHRPTHDAAVSQRNLLLFATGVGTLLFGFFLTWVILKFISRPIRELINANKAVTQGDLTVRLNSDRQDEFGALAKFFDRMLDQIVQELAERKQAEELLRKSEEHVKNILDSIHAGIIVIDPAKHEIMLVNSFAAEMVGASKEEIVGQVCHPFLCPTESGNCPITDHNEIVDNSERVLITKMGECVPILKSVVQLSHRGQPLLIESFISIKDRKRAEERLARSSAELREANEDLRSFAYIVSHDLRAPLVSIKGFSEELGISTAEITALLEKYQPVLQEEDRKLFEQLVKQDIRESLAFIGSSVTRMDRLITSVLKLSRLGHQELKSESVDMKVLVQSILSSLAHQIEAKQVQVVIGDLPVVTADRQSMEQVMGNLFDNALKYLEPGRAGEITVNATQINEETTFHISDNGRGIAADDMNKVFELFRRAGKQDMPGEGMGLTYVKTIVKRHGGRIWCESKLGQGTTFSFSVPHPPETQIILPGLN